jgi:hypothetical protein
MFPGCQDPVTRILAELGGLEPRNMFAASAYCGSGPPVTRAPFRRRPGPVHHQLMMTFVRPCRPPRTVRQRRSGSLGAGETLSGKEVSVKSEAASSTPPLLTCDGGIEGLRDTVSDRSRTSQRALGGTSPGSPGPAAGHGSGPSQKFWRARAAWLAGAAQVPGCSLLHRDAADGALAVAQDQEPAVQQVRLGRAGVGLGDLAVVQVGAACGDSPPRRRAAGHDRGFRH